MITKQQNASETRTDRLLVSLDSLRSKDRGSAGGKAVSLARMIRAGLPVPGGFCITTPAFWQFMEGVEGGHSVYGILESVDARSLDQVHGAAERVRQRLAATPFPEPVRDAIVAAWEHCEPGMAWAIRSSAIAEDLPGASFAGQHDTFLNVRGREAVLEAVRGCWMSLFTDRAMLYRMKNRIPHRSAAMAVVVQEMAPAEAAGVLFTADPTLGETGRMIIEATYGLGESLASGKVSPDRIVLKKDTLAVIEWQVNRKTIETVPDKAGSIRQREVDVRKCAEACLDEKSAQRLGELGQQVERLFGRPQDIEWAVSGGSVFLLQSRPITTVGKLESQEQTIWSNANVSEAAPDVVTPMTWSVVSVLLAEFLNPLFRRLGMNLDRRPLTGLIGGRVYMNVSTAIELLRSLPMPTTVDLNQALGGYQEKLGTSLPTNLMSGKQSLSFRRLAHLPGLVVWLLINSTKQSRLIAEWCQRAEDALARADVSAMSDDELAGFIPGLLLLVSRGADGATGAAAIWMAAGGIGGAMAVFRLASRWLGDEDGTLANRLISGSSRMASAEAALDLWRLAEWARAHPPVAQVLLIEQTFAAAGSALGTTPLGQEFLNRWQAFMASHGHHTRGEFDVYNPRWSETPDYVLDMLRIYLRISDEANPLKLRAERLRQRRHLLAGCQRRLRNPLKRWLFNFMIKQAQHGLAQRENVKNEGVRAIACIRRALLEAGERLTRRGILRERDDVFFLDLKELRQVLTGPVAFDATGIIAARKVEYARNQEIVPPPVVVGHFDSESFIPEAADAKATLLKGLAISPGIVTGKARVILRADTDERVLPGEILVAPFTDPGWSPYFIPAAGLVADIGGQLSHGSIVAREHGIPAVVNVGPATKIIQTGQLIRVDGHRGLVTILADD